MLGSVEYYFYLNTMKIEELFHKYQSLKMYISHYFDYNKEDPFSYMCVVGTVLPPTISVGLAVSYIYSRNKTVGKILLGLVINELTNVALKYTVRDPRPSTCGFPDYGFPSSHAQQMFFFAVVLSRYATRRTAKDALFVLALFVAWSRYYLGFHDIKQVVGGSVIGTVIGTVFANRYLVK